MGKAKCVNNKKKRKIKKERRGIKLLREIGNVSENETAGKEKNLHLSLPVLNFFVRIKRKKKISPRRH